jgi:uncharacterized protein
MKLPSLIVLNLKLAVCRLEANDTVPGWVFNQPFWSVTRTGEEISLILPDDMVPADWQVERGWRAFKVEGPLDFGLIGILSEISSALARNGISIFALSTYDTDYILLKAEKLDCATAALREAGYIIAAG